MGRSPCSYASRRGRSSAAGDRVPGAGGVTGAGDKDRDGAASSAGRPSGDVRGRGGGGDLGVWCGNGKGRRKCLDAGLLFFGMTVALLGHKPRRAASGWDECPRPIIIDKELCCNWF
jgi:hypothetical protein